MVAILEKIMHNIGFHQIVDFLEASHIRVETTDGETKILAQVNGRTVELFASMLVPQGEGSKHPFEPHHTTSAQNESIHHEQITQSTQHAQITSPEPIPQSHEQTTSQEPTIPSQSHSVITIPKRINRGTIRISQSKVPSPGADETAFPTGDVRFAEAFHTDTSFDAGQDIENVAKTYAMPHEALPRVTSLGGDEGDILASGGLRAAFTTASLSVATASTCISFAVATASRSFHTAAIFTTASVATSTTKQEGKRKGKMTKPEQPSKEKIARTHAERELEMMIAELDRSNEMIAKYLILRSNAGWKAKDFKGMTFEQIEEKFILVWEKMQDFMPMNSKLESKRLKRPGFQLDKERIKKLKTAKASGTKPTQEQQSEEPKELSEEELKKMMELVPVEELYIEALQGKYPIID
nr:hypothetical protein [Tanacetum cinerariifolium]